MTCRTPVQARRDENLLSLAQRIGGLVRANDDDLCLEGVCARCEMVVDGELVRACVHDIQKSPSSASTDESESPVLVEILPMIEDCDAWLEYTTHTDDEQTRHALGDTSSSTPITSHDASIHAEDTADNDDLSLFV